MKKLLLSIFTLGTLMSSNAQVWNYAGTGTSSDVIARSGNIWLSSTGSATTPCTSCISSSFNYNTWKIYDNTSGTTLSTLVTPGQIELRPYGTLMGNTINKNTLTNQGLQIVQFANAQYNVGYGATVDVNLTDGFKIYAQVSGNYASSTLNRGILSIASEAYSAGSKNILELTHASNTSSLKIDGFNMNLSTTGNITTTSAGNVNVTGTGAISTVSGNISSTSGNISTTSGTITGANLVSTNTLKIKNGTTDKITLSNTGNIKANTIDLQQGLTASNISIGGNVTTGNEFIGSKLSVTGNVNASKMHMGGLNYGRIPGVGYIGFNAKYDMASDTWTTESDGASNSGPVILGDVWGNLYFSRFKNNEEHTTSKLFDNASIKMSENGTLYAKAVEVTLSSSVWPDYVFKSDYKLKSLSEVESYVKENSHLPGVPSAAEVEKGLDLAKMNAALLEKVEELYLHSIEQEKDIDALKLELKKLKN